MATKNNAPKIKRGEVDRWTGNAITNVSKNTPEQQRAVDEINGTAKGGKAPAKKPAPKKK